MVRSTNRNFGTIAAHLGILLPGFVFLLSVSLPGVTDTISVRDSADAPRVAGSYSEAKRWLYGEVFADRPETLYCNCPFDAERRPDHARCGYPTESRDARAFRIEAEHVVPASWIGRGRACWEEPICVAADGDRFRGRDCCLRIDPDYRRAHNDLHNLWPTVGEVNQQRGNYRFGMIPGEAREFGQCDFEVDHDGRVIEPRPEVWGDIARIGFYMERVHGVWLADDQLALFETWNRADPPDAFERERNARIRRLQGQGNPFIEDYEERLARLPGVPGGALVDVAPIEGP